MVNSFSPDQREYIDSHRPDMHSQTHPDSFDHPDQLKSNIRRGPASRQTISKQIREFTDYLSQVEAFYRQVESQPQGRTEWEQIVLPSIRRRIERLQKHLERLEVESEKSEGVLREALQPLWRRLEEIGDVHGVPTPPPLPEDEEYQELEKDYFDEVEEYKERVNALQRLVEDQLSDRDDGEYLHEILEYIRENEKSNHPNPLTNKPKYRASRVLRTCPGCNQDACAHLGLVTESQQAWMTYKLTERGRAVFEAFENLQSVPFVPTEDWQNILGHLFHE